jgi:hypothetical protein
METTLIEEVAGKNRDKKELTVYDFAMSYSQGSVFEVKANKLNHRPSEVSPNQIEGVISSPKQDDQQIIEENRDSQPTSMPSSL